MELFESIGQALYNSLVYENRYTYLLDGLWTTMLLTFASFLLGTVLGALFCRMMLAKHKGLRRFAGAVTQFFIQIPALVLLMLFAYVIFAGAPLSVVVIAVICFTIKTGSYMADIFYSAVSSVAPGEVEAARALGMSSFQAFRRVGLPQAVRFAMPLYRNQFIQTLQETSIVGYIAIQDLTYASEVIAARTMDPVTTLLIITVAYLVTGAAVSGLLRLATREKHIGGVAA